MNIVREQLFEIKKNIKGSGLGNIGVGKNTMIKSWLKDIGITDYGITEKGFIDVYSDVCFLELSGLYENYKLEAFPDYIQFGTIYGKFDLSNCGMLHLKGCPIKVVKTFDCSQNELSSLDFCPKFVLGEFVCYDNFVRFKKNDVESRCKVSKGIYVTEEEFTGGSVEYNKELKKYVEGM